MVRWEGGARERLQAAALELFTERGFDGVTAAEIALRAGLTERTFFRYFADKREVLFAGGPEYEARFVDAIRASSSTEPMALVEAALGGAAGFFADERRPWSRGRQSVIDSHPGLQERELLKGAALAQTVEREMRERNVPPLAAAVAAQTLASVHHLAFARWIAPGETRSMAVLQRELMDQFRAVLTAQPDLRGAARP